MLLVCAVYHGFLEEAVGVVPTVDLAEALVAKIKELWNLEDCEITSDKFEEMAEAISWDGDGIEPFLDNFPEYSVSDIERAVKYYPSCRFLGCVIRKVEHFTCYDDILNYGTDH